LSPRVPIPSRDEIPPIPTVAVLAHTPALAQPFLGWAAALALNGMLTRRDHELVALRAIHHCRSEFERVEHTQFARDAGLDDDEIARIEAGPDAPGWEPGEAALLRAVDELHASCAVSDSTWAVLANHYEPGQLVEIPYVAGQYTMLSMVANALGIEASR
jgi:4-carboxymuconolactone decarboxylase